MSFIPKTLHYTQTHEWVKSKDGEITLGITDHAQSLLGDLVFVDLPEVGNKICAGDEIAVVESVKAASDVYSPVNGVIIAVNHKVSEKPALVNQSPYDAGWLVKIKTNQSSEPETLLDATSYEELTARDH